MKCHKCEANAAINLRQHHLALCGEHYPEWFVQQTERAIKKYGMFTPDERILVAVSGGKDSLALWDVLLRLGYRTGGLYIDLGIDAGIAYSESSKAKAQAFADEWPEARLHVVDLHAEYGESIPDLAERKRRTRRPCSICGLVKRHEMNRVALTEGYDVLATGHNLDDEVATLFGNVLRWDTGYICRQAPVLPAEGEGLARKVKPFCRFYERDVAAYTLLREIDYIYDECPFSRGATSIAYKETLARLEHDAPGTKMRFYLSFLKAKSEEGLCAAVEEKNLVLHPCRQCGQPTTAPELCAFCRLWESPTVGLRDAHLNTA